MAQTKQVLVLAIVTKMETAMMGNQGGVDIAKDVLDYPSLWGCQNQRVPRNSKSGYILMGKVDKKGDGR